MNNTPYAWQPTASIDVLKQRALLIAAIRNCRGNCPNMARCSGKEKHKKETNANVSAFCCFFQKIDREHPDSPGLMTFILLRADGARHYKD